MNTVERVVDAYFRLCRQCFTMHDVGIVPNDNRKFGLVAINMCSGSQYHVECAIHYCTEWQPTEDELLDEFDRKFFGIPWSYEVFNGYRNIGINPGLVERIYCCWLPPKLSGLKEMLHRYSVIRGIRTLKIVSFHEEILPQVQEVSALSRQENDALKILGLLRKTDSGGVRKRDGAPVR